MIRAALSFLAFLFTYIAVSCVLPYLHNNSINQIIAIGSGLAAAWAVMRIPKQGPGERILKCTGIGALIVGGIGFAGGFFGPILFRPDANQGPLLGIFITGPIGFVLGGAGGFIVGLMRSKKPPVSEKYWP